MSHYLIEFRFFGKAKYELKQLIRDVDYKFYLRRGHKVPHITLVGPFNTNDQSKLVSDFKRICSNQELMHFEVDGFSTFENTGVVFIDVKPDNNLDEFRWQLSKTLQSYCNLTKYDNQRNFNYHATIAMKLHSDKCRTIKKYIDSKPQPKFKHVLMRVTLLKNQYILYEYDFLLKCMLNRSDALSKDVLSRTFDKLKDYLGNSTSQEEPVSNSSQSVEVSSEIEELDLSQIKESPLSKFISIFRKRRIFFISDTHFDHKNIIRYCQRPFKSKSEMNDIILNNWNNTVKGNDVVFFLGDMSYGRGSKNADSWLRKLNGTIYFIRGNHERISETKNVYNKLIIKYENKKFFLTHDPANVPTDWKEWAICGHHHNNKLEEFPLVNKKTKRINVSVELIDYTPILFETLLDKI